MAATFIFDSKTTTELGSTKHLTSLGWLLFQWWPVTTSKDQTHSIDWKWLKKQPSRNQTAKATVRSLLHCSKWPGILTWSLSNYQTSTAILLSPKTVDTQFKTSTLMVFHLFFDKTCAFCTFWEIFRKPETGDLLDVWRSKLTGSMFVGKQIT